MALKENFTVVLSLAVLISTCTGVTVTIDSLGDVIEGSETKMICNYSPTSGGTFVITWNNVTGGASKEIATTIVGVSKGVQPAYSAIFSLDPNDDRVLVINDTLRSYSGDYQCEVSIVAVSTGNDDVTLNVIYIDDPVLSFTTPVIEGDPVALSCDVVSKPNAQFTFKKDGSVLQDGGLSTYNFTADRNDQGNYTCETSNSAGTKATGGQVLEVHYFESSNVITINVNSNTTAHNVTITCSGTVDGNPDPVINLYRDNNMIKTQTTLPLTYTIATVSDDDNGMYRCEAINTAGSVTSNTSVTLNYYLTGTVTISSPSNDTTIVVTCSGLVDGNPSPDITLHKDGDIIPQQSTLPLIYTIGSPTENDAGNYTCEANNTIFSTSSELELNKPRYETDTEPDTLKPGDKVTITVENVEANPQEVSYVWSIGGIMDLNANSATFKFTASMDVGTVHEITVMVTNLIGSTSKTIQIKVSGFTPLEKALIIIGAFVGIVIVIILACLLCKDSRSWLKIVIAIVGLVFIVVFIGIPVWAITSSHCTWWVIWLIIAGSVVLFIIIIYWIKFCIWLIEKYGNKNREINHSGEIVEVEDQEDGSSPGNEDKKMLTSSGSAKTGKSSSFKVKPAKADISTDSCLQVEYTLATGEIVQHCDWYKCDKKGGHKNFLVRSGDANSRLAVADDGSLKIPKVKEEDDGYYCCEMKTSLKVVSFHVKFTVTNASKNGKSSLKKNKSNVEPAIEMEEGNTRRYEAKSGDLYTEVNLKDKKKKVEPEKDPSEHYAKVDMDKTKKSDRPAQVDNQLKNVEGLTYAEVDLTRNLPKDTINHPDPETTYASIQQQPTKI